MSQTSTLTNFPAAVPEIPVNNVNSAAEYYVNVLGFHFDWGKDEGGIGGISQGACRMFLTNAPFRAHYGTCGPVMIWLNLNSRQEVDELYHRWRQAGAKIVAEPEDKPGTCASLGPRILTEISCASSTTFHGSCARNRGSSLSTLTFNVHSIDFVINVDNRNAPGQS